MNNYLLQKNIMIAKNSEDVQAVYSRGQNIWQMIFYTANSTFENDSMKVTMNQPSAIMIKDFSSTHYSIHVANPSQNASIVEMNLKLPKLNSNKLVKITLPSGNFKGQTTVVYIKKDFIDKKNFETVVTRIYPVEDTYINSASQKTNINYGKSDYILVKNDEAGYKRYGLLKFDISKVDPSNGGIVDVKVNMGIKDVNSGSTASTYSWDLWKIPDGDTYWIEGSNNETIQNGEVRNGVTWDNFKSVVENALLNGDNKLATTGNVAFKKSLVKWDATTNSKLLNYVREKFENNYNKNVSFAIYGSSKGAKTDVTFYSKEQVVTNELVDYLPYIEIVEVKDVKPAVVVNGNTIQTTLRPIEDGFINQAQAGSNYGKSDHIIVKSEGGSYNRYGLLKFDLSKIDTARYGSVTKVELKMQIKFVNSSGVVKTANWDLWHIPNSKIWGEGSFDDYNVSVGAEKAINWNNFSSTVKSLFSNNVQKVSNTGSVSFVPGPIKWESTSSVNSGLIKSVNTELNSSSKKLSLVLSGGILDTKSDVFFYSNDQSVGTDDIRYVPTLVITQTKSNVTITKVDNSTTQLSIIPTNDSYINELGKQNNYGQSETLLVKNQPGSADRISFMKFDVSSIDTLKYGTIKSVELKMAIKFINSGATFKTFNWNLWHLPNSLDNWGEGSLNNENFTGSYTSGITWDNFSTNWANIYKDNNNLLASTGLISFTEGPVSWFSDNSNSVNLLKRFRSEFQTTGNKIFSLGVYGYKSDVKSDVFFYSKNQIPGTPLVSYTPTLVVTFQKTANKSRVGIMEELKEKDNSLVVYPNPTADFTSIKSSFSGKGTILNSIGLEVMRFDVVQDVPLRLNVTKLLPGSYTVNVTNGVETETSTLVKAN